MDIASFFVQYLLIIGFALSLSERDCAKWLGNGNVERWARADREDLDWLYAKIMLAQMSNRRVG